MELDDALEQMMATYTNFANIYIGAPALEVCIDYADEYKRIVAFVAAEYTKFEVLSDKIIVM